MNEDGGRGFGTDRELARPVTVGTFLTPWQALLARARLEAEGIDVVIADEHLIRMDWFIAGAVGGVKVQVWEEDVERASEILRSEAPLPDLFLVRDDEPFRAEPRCPSCLSSNLDYERWSRRIFFGSLVLFGFPLPVPARRWRCARCGERWKEGELVEG